MKISRIKNGFRITVKEWSNEVVITNITDKTSVKKTFSDHIKAVMIAKSL